LAFCPWFPEQLEEKLQSDKDERQSIFIDDNPFQNKLELMLVKQFFGMSLNNQGEKRGH
jgi:hypothetical protein